LAVRFLFETSDALGDEPKFEFEPFSAKASRNDYEVIKLIPVWVLFSDQVQIPWSLRGLIGDPRCQELFGKEIAELRNAFDDWHPRTSVLKDVRKKLEPIRGRRSRFAPDPFNYTHPSSSTNNTPISPAFSVNNKR
jgi:hypothetical protein